MSQHLPDRIFTGPNVVAALVVTCAVAVFHVANFLHAGALWRDEVASVTLATLPDTSEMWRLLHLESFPLGWSLALRTWLATGLGQTDLGLRSLGLAIGLGIVAALWFNSRQIGYRAPAFSLALFALNPAVIRWGDSVREFGLGVLIYLLAVGFLWRTNETGWKNRALAAALLGLASVQCLFINILFLGAACLGAAAVDIRRRRWRRLAVPISVMLTAGVSLMPYIQVMRRKRSWDDLIRIPLPLSYYVGDFNDTLSAPGRGLSRWWSSDVRPAGEGSDWLLAAGRAGEWLWWIVLALAIVFVLRGTRASKKDVGETSGDDRALFAVTSIASGGLFFFAFLVYLQYPTAPWYFLGLMASWAVGFDILFCPLLNQRLGRAVQAAVLLLGLALVGPFAWQQSFVRATNVDAAAALVGREGHAPDLVVVEPWFLGISFARYYDAEAPWTTVPPVSDHRFHRFDTIKDEMVSPAPMSSVLKRVSDTLRSGGRVWVVRLSPRLAAGQPPVRLPAAPATRSGWHFGPYMVAWSTQLDAYLREAAGDIRERELPAQGPCNPAEQARVFEAHGR